MDANQPDRLDRWIPRAMVLAVLAVAVFAFVQSYTHMYLLAQAHHNSGASLRMMPLSVDWVMFAAGLVMLHLKRKGLKHPLPRVALYGGATVTLAANVASGIIWGWEAAVISAWAPIALFTVVELGMLLVKVAKVKPPKPKPPTMAERMAAIAQEFHNERAALRGDFLQEPYLGKPQPAPDPSPETAAFPRTYSAEERQAMAAKGFALDEPEAVDSPEPALEGWGQLAGQEPAEQTGLTGIGLKNGAHRRR